MSNGIKMAAFGMLAIVLGVFIGWSLFAEGKPEVQAKPKVEVVFVLDTTGSMSGLIEGAKQKIWSIANEIIKGKPTPDLRIGLVAYRDMGDAYVTKVFDLSDDIDKVYSNLMGFKAAGGGDGPEHVNKALSDGVSSMKWDGDPKTVKIVFLVGDAPPHMDYKDGFDYKAICEQGVKKDLIINTIRCGGDPQTATFWQDIARRGEGEFITIAQSGGMEMVSTPVDEELAKLNMELEGTRIAYGGDKAEKELLRKSKLAGDMSAGVAAARVVYEAKSGYVSEYDLVGRIEAGELDIEKIERKELSEKLQEMKKEDLEKYISEKVNRRKEIKEKIERLNEERSKYVREYLASKGGKKDAFDEKVISILKEQAGKKGIEY